jgi:Flp pilus assembly secretin CpaC
MKFLVQKFALVCVLFLPATASFSAKAEQINVVLDRASVLRLPEKVATIVIGNPSVADGSLQRGGLLVVTGKGYGETNLLALDSHGDTLAEYLLNVSGPKIDSKLTIYRGVERETWSCAPKCEHAVVLGDSNAYFNAASGQVSNRNGHSAPAGTAAK